MTLGGAPLGGGILGGAPLSPSIPVAADEATTDIEVEFTPGVWTSLAGRVLDGTTDYGRNSQLDSYGAGTLNARLDNSDRALDPTYTGSPYYPHVVPGVRVRVRQSYAGVDRIVGTFRVVKWPQTYPGPNLSIVPLLAQDALRNLAMVKMPASPYAAQMELNATLAWYRFGETAGAQQMVDSSGHGRHGIYSQPAADLTGKSLIVQDGDGALTTTGTEFARIPHGAQPSSFPFSIECWFRTKVGGGIWSQVAGTNQYARIYLGLGTILTEVRSSTTAYKASQTTGNNYADNRTHHLVVVFPSAANAPLIYIDGQPASQVNTGGTAPTIAQGAAFVALDKVGGTQWDGTLDELAIYPAALTLSQIQANHTAGATAWAGDTTGARIGRLLDIAGWTGARALDAGVSRLGAATFNTSQSVLEAIKEVEQSEQGRAYLEVDETFIFHDRYWPIVGATPTTVQATFVDDGTDYADLVVDYSDDLVYTAVTVTFAGGLTATASVPGVTQVRELGISAPQLRDANEALSLAQWVLAHYKDPLVRVTALTVKPMRDPTNAWAAVLDRRIGDRLRVQRTPQGLGAAIDVQVLVERIVRQFAPRKHTITMQLGPAETGSYFKWDSSLLDGTDGWAY